MRLFVALAGGSCVGKTFVASALLAHFGGHCEVISTDDFYQDRSAASYSELLAMNFDSVVALDLDLAQATLLHLAKGLPTRVPLYDSITHARTGWRWVFPTDVLLLEGMHAVTVAASVADKLPRDIRIFAIFLTVAENIRRRRRQQREVRGATVPQEFDEYWMSVCEPTYRLEVEPQASRCDLVLDMTDPAIGLSQVSARLDAILEGQT